MTNLQIAKEKLSAWLNAQGNGSSYWFSKEYDHHVVTLKAKGRTVLGIGLVKWVAIENALRTWKEKAND